MFEKFYEKAWDPSAFGACDHGSGAAAAGGKVEKCKVYVPNKAYLIGPMVQVAADIVGAQCEVVVTEDKSKSPSGKLPYFELADGTLLHEPEAIVNHYIRMNPSCGLHGNSVFEQAKIAEWSSWVQQNESVVTKGCLLQIWGLSKADSALFNKHLKSVMDLAKHLDSQLKGKKWLLGNNFTAADLFVGTFMTLLMQLVIDESSRKKFPNLSKWW